MPNQINLNNPLQQSDPEITIDISRPAERPDEIVFDLSASNNNQSAPESTPSPSINPVMVHMEEEEERPARSIPVRPTPISFRDRSEVTKVDPAELSKMFRKKQETGTDEEGIKSLADPNRAYEIVEKAVDRKKAEFAAAMDLLEAKDQENRMAIAEGIIDPHEIAGEEVYMKDTDTMNDADAELSDDDAFDRELERGLIEAERTAEVAAGTGKKVRILGNDQTAKVEPVVVEEDDPVDNAPVLSEEVDEVEVEPTVVVEEPRKETVDRDPMDLFKNSGKSLTVTKHEDSAILDSIKEVKSTDFQIDEKDIDDLDTNTTDADAEQKLFDDNLAQLKTAIMDKVINTAKKYDISSFRISKKPTNYQNALTKIKAQPSLAKATATWALMANERPYVCSALTGPELTMLYQIDNNNSQFVVNIQQLQVLYQHDENPYKPGTLEGWAKTLAYADIDEIFMAEYVATFGNGNYMPYTCEEKTCMNMELIDQDDPMKLVEFKDDKTKEKFERIRSTPLNKDMSTAYESVIVPINDEIAIGFRIPSIYTVMYEIQSISKEFLEKYFHAVNTIMYIDTIYLIDPESNDLVPITYKEYPNDVSKTFRSKVVTYARLMAPLKNEYNMIVAYINNMNGIESGLKYVVPEAKCSKCGKVIEKVESTAKSLVFIRPRLVDIATISNE